MLDIGGLKLISTGVRGQMKVECPVRVFRADEERRKEMRREGGREGGRERGRSN